MSDEFRPSHRRSEETGKVKTDFDEASVQPTYFDDPPPAVERASRLASTPHQEALRRIFELLEGGPPKTMPARLAGLKRVLRMDDPRSVRDAAERSGCTVSTLFRYEREMKRFFRGKTSKNETDGL